MNALPALDCDQVVELVTDLLEGALDGPTAERVRAHLAECPGCDTYVDQIRQTVRMLGAATSQSLPPQAQESLVAAFRDFRRQA
jgi:predicted anti-sigma-YlaC factor YlaD